MPYPGSYLSLTLHAHLPYVVNHGTWPHGLEWLHEAAAETYLPLLRMLDRLQADGIVPGFNIDFSPVLLEQLTHPVFQIEFPNYLQRKVQYAREDEAFFDQAGESHYADLARFWQATYQAAIDDFARLRGDITGEFRRFAEAGMIDLLTCAATHGYGPLLGSDECLRAQIRVAVQTHRRHFGSAPKGIWLPECGYRPPGYWQAPLAATGQDKPYAGFFRIGMEQAVAESGLQFFFVDAHLVQASNRFVSPYGGSGLASNIAINVADDVVSSSDYAPGDEKLYQAYGIADSPTAIFARDPRTGFQVWSGDSGYPGDAVYLDFHKKRWPGGHRYWRVTGPGIDLADKVPYNPEIAVARTADHAQNFVALVQEALAQQAPNETAQQAPVATAQQAPSEAKAAHRPPILSALFDAELFGHWWSEGVLFLEQVARLLASREAGVASTTAAAYLKRHPPAESIRMPEGSWGAGGDDRVWLNADTSWTYAQLYEAEHELREICTLSEWRDGGLGERILKQLCRELLLLESSDWQFLITTGAARDYAERRFHQHAAYFQELRELWKHFDRERQISPGQESQLRTIEERDGIFPDVNPEFWVRGAKV